MAGCSHGAVSPCPVATKRRRASTEPARSCYSVAGGRGGYNSVPYAKGIETISPWYGQASGVLLSCAGTGFIRTYSHFCA